MKVFIMTDLEGVSLANSPLLWDTSTREYALACERLMADTNAAILGALDAGATEILVYDGHGRGCNFLPGKLHP